MAGITRVLCYPQLQAGRQISAVLGIVIMKVFRAQTPNPQWIDRPTLTSLASQHVECDIQTYSIAQLHNIIIIDDWH